MNKRISIILNNLIMITGFAGSAPYLGITNGRLKPCPNKPNCVNSQSKDEKHFIRPFYYTGTQQEAKANLLKILKAEKKVKILTIQDNYIHSEFTSAVFKFVDDVEFYFPAKGKKIKTIHIRSASRIGYSDLGANRKRVEQIRDKFKLIKN